jgi:antitoxin VapB
MMSRNLHETSVVPKRLEEREWRLARDGSSAERARYLKDLLEREIWPQVPPEVLGEPVSRKDGEAILGYGSEGV